MVEYFAPEKQKIAKVEGGAAEKGYKTLSEELKKRHALFFMEVDTAGKLFDDGEKIADKLGTTEAKEEMAFQRGKMKSFLEGVAEKGQQILKMEKQGPTVKEYHDLRSMADAVKKFTEDAKRDKPLYEAVDKSFDLRKKAESAKAKVNDLLARKGKMKSADFEREIRKALDENCSKLMDARGQLDDYRVEKIESVVLKSIFLKARKDIDSRFARIGRVRLDLSASFKNPDIAYLAAAKGVFESVREVIRRLLEIKMDIMVSPQENIKKWFKTLLDGASNKLLDGKAYLQDLNQVFLDANPEYEALAKELLKKNREQSSLVAEMKAYADDNDWTFSKEQKNTPLDTQKAFEQSQTKLVDPKLRDDIVQAKKIQEELFGERVDKNTKEWKEKISAMDTIAKKAQDRLAQLKGELLNLNKEELDPNEQIHLGRAVRSVTYELQEIANIHALCASQSLIENVNKGGTKYVKWETRMVNGIAVAAPVFTEAFKKLPLSEQNTISEAFAIQQIKNSVDIVGKMGLKEDKLWLDGQDKYEKKDRAGSKAALKAYVDKFLDNPEKQLQVNSAKGLLARILKEDFDEVKEHFGLLKQTIEGRSGGISGKFDKLRSVHDKYGRLDAINGFIKEAETLITSGEFLTIDEVYKKLPKLKDSIDLKSDGISMLDPFEQQQLLSESDPVKRRQNILKLARAAHAVELTSLAAKYYEMYFQDRIDNAKKSISRDKIKVDFEAEELKSGEFRAEIQAQIKSFHDSARQKFMDDYYKQHPQAKNPSLSPDDPEVKAMKAAEAAWEKSYDSQKGNVYQQAKDMLIDIRYGKAAKLAIHSGVEAITRSGSGMAPTTDELVWKEAYGNTFGNVENITGEHLIFTQDDFYELQSKLAGSILTMEIATLAAMTVAAGTSAAIAGGAVAEGAIVGGVVGEATVAAGGGTAGFLLEGAVLHSVSSYLNEGKLDPTSPQFLRGLASTYATLGIMKATGLGAGVKLGGKQAVAGAETATARALGAAAKGGAEFLGKVTLDSVLMTGLSTIERGLIDKKWASFDEMAGEFGNNAVTFFVIGGLHKVAEGGEAGKPSKSKVIAGSDKFKPEKISPEAKAVIDYRPPNQPEDIKLREMIDDNKIIEQNYKGVAKKVKELQSRLFLKKIPGGHDELYREIEELQAEEEKFRKSLEFERNLENEARQQFVKEHFVKAQKEHPEIATEVLQELLFRNPNDFERVIYLAKKGAILEVLGFKRAARDLRNITADFASVDGSPLKTAAEREAFVEKILTLSPIEREWYQTRPETTLDPNDPHYQQKFNALKEFNAKFVSEKVIPHLIGQNMPFYDLALTLHRWQTKGSLAQLQVLQSPQEGYDIAGKIRDVQVYVGNYVPPTFSRVPEILDAINAKVPSIEQNLEIMKIDPAKYEEAVVKTAFYVLQTFVEIHPMRDGNGRTSRALFEYYIAKHLGIDSKYYRLPVTERYSGEPTLHDDLAIFNDQLSKNLYKDSSLGRFNGLIGDSLMEKIKTTDLKTLMTDPIYAKFFATLNLLMQ